MKTLRFVASIEASRDAVWDAMLGPDTYRVWTSEFAEGSYYEGSWNTGDRIRFLGPDGRGMTAVIDECRPGEFLSIKHLGMIAGGVEDTDSDEVRAWAPSFEKYSLSDTGTATEVVVDIDVPPDWEQFMLTTWPKALARLKAMCESSAG